MRQVVRLAAVASSVWPQLEAHYYQIDLLKLRGAKLLNLVYVWYLQTIPSDKIQEVLTELDDLLPWEDSTSAAAEEIESASFMAMMAKGEN